MSELIDPSDLKEEYIDPEELKNETVNEDLARALIEKLRPYLQYEGGDIEFVKVKDNYVYVRLTGACVGCGMIGYTYGGIEDMFKEEIPAVKGVVLVDSFGHPMNGPEAE